MSRSLRAAPPRSVGLTRQTWVVLHRWAGLTITLFLVVVGSTGALLPFYEELTFAGRPSLSRALPPRPGAQPLDGVELAARVERQTGASIAYLPLEVSRDHVASLSVTAGEGRPALGYDTVWADPYSGAVRLAYRRQALSDGPQAIMDFLFALHENLALGRVGQLALGIAALVWTLDCFVGFYVTLPVARRTAPERPREAPQPGRGWLTRWRPAWAVRWRAGGHKLTFDLHRAGGLWIWPLLLVFAWSSVGFNLREVHQPVMRALGSAEVPRPPRLVTPVLTPRIDRAEAAAIGARLLAEEGRRRGFRVIRPTLMGYEPATGTYRYMARSTLDVVSTGGRTNLWFSGADGRMVSFLPPVQPGAADGAMRWMYMLHMAQVWGLPYRIFVSTLGLGIVGLSVTGALIWMKKRSARLLKVRRKRVERGYAGDLAIPAE